MAVSSAQPTHWALALPVESPETDTQVLKQLSRHAKAKTAKKGSSQYLGELSQLDVPKNPKTGTLDSLLRLADKLDGLLLLSAQCLTGHEQQLRNSAPAAAAGGSAAPREEIALTVDGYPVNEWIRRHFRWDAAQYDDRQPLLLVADRLRDTVATLDRQRREQLASVAHVEALVARGARSKSGGLSGQPLAWILTRDVISRTRMADWYFDVGREVGAWPGSLCTEFVVVHPGKKADFLASYERLALGEIAKVLKAANEDADEEENEAAAAAPSSPVVPRSARAIVEPEGDSGECLFAVTVLSSFVGLFRAAAAAEARSVFTVRTDLDEDPQQRLVVRRRILGSAADEADDDVAASGNSRRTRAAASSSSSSSRRAAEAEAAEAALEAAKAELATSQAELEARLADAKARMRRDCQARYEEAVRAHLHVVGLQLIVESVLRYGLPVRYAYAIVRPKGPTEAATLQKQLQEAYESVGRTYAVDDSGASSSSSSVSSSSSSSSHSAIKLPLVCVTCRFESQV